MLVSYVKCVKTCPYSEKKHGGDTLFKMKASTERARIPALKSGQRTDLLKGRCPDREKRGEKLLLQEKQSLFSEG